MSCYLLQHGADLYQPNKKGETPVSIVVNHRALLNTLTSFVKHNKLPHVAADASS